ncbi:MAG TPA: hypothetical protein VFE46_16025 [Pirellulales bacterium]|nr:hypothetical protein [Pirellulales bacterium]
MLSVFTAAQLRANGQLEIHVVDRDTGQPLAVRMHLKNAQGKPVKPPGVPTLGDHFVFYDKLVLRLPNGGYEFLIERGPEYLDQNGHFEIENFADDTKTVEMRRFVDMAQEGWYSGDLDVDRPAKDLELVMRADDVHVVPLITWSNKKEPPTKNPVGIESPQKAAVHQRAVKQFDGSFFYSLLGGELTAPGTTLRLFRLEKPLELIDAAAAGQSKAVANVLGSLPWLPVVKKARGEQKVWVDAGAFFARDLPIWIAAGQIDSIQLANRHMQRDGVVDNEAGGWPRDLSAFPKPYGNGRWSQEIYYHLLNCGLRIPPTAGSGSGFNNNPVGYNRVYVNVPSAVNESGSESSASTKQGGDAKESALAWDQWWNALHAGRAIITNGPLIRPNVEGQLPGYVFKADDGKTVELLIALTLSTREKIRYLEVIKNGRSEIEANLDDFRSSGGKLPPLKFNASGWFLVRAITDNSQTYRYATTAPYYVEIGYHPHISRASVQFFLDWTNKRSAEIVEALKADDSATAQDAIHCVQQAQEYWRAMLRKATED